MTECFSMFLNEGQLDLRTRAKVGIIEICKNLGDWYRILRGKMNPLCFKSVCELMTKTNGRVEYDMGSNSQPKQSRMRPDLNTIATDDTSKPTVRSSSIKRE